jgi:uncharacterized protein YecE (DUF72 family)
VPTLAGRRHVGCSGWSYADWRGPVYPREARPAEWFRLYAAQFQTVEINNWFYRLPAVSQVEAWAAQAPPGFVFAPKLGQFGSHRKKLADARTWLPNHVQRAERLGRHLGPTLVQLPPRWRRNLERLEEFFQAAPSSMRWAVEVRDPSWLHDDTYAVLERHKAALCLHDLVSDHPWIRTADWTYVRFHGPEAQARRYLGRYSGRRLWRVADRLAEWLDAGVDVYAYFNNDHNGDAVVDAHWLDQRLGELVSAAA